MLLIYVSHWRFPSAKVSSRIAMRTCEEFIRHGQQAELWIPWRRNPQFRGVDSFAYHRVARSFVLHRLPAVDLLGILPGKLGFFLMLVSFNISVVCYAFLRGLVKKAVFYPLDFRNVILLNIFKPSIYLEAHDFYKTPWGWLNYWCYRGARGVIATNHMKMQSLQKEFGLLPERMLHKPCPVDTAMFRISTPREEARKTLGLPADQTIILYCGQVVLWKGVDILLEAPAFLTPQEFIYVIVGGDDISIAEFKDKHKAINPRNVILVEGKTHKDIPLWLRAADVLVLPNTARDYTSKYDTSPVKLFEYMASGTPIVSSDLPSLRNIVDENMVWFFEPDNPRALAGAIHSALADSSKSREKSARAQEEAEKYTWQKRFTDIFKFIEVTMNL